MKRLQAAASCVVLGLAMGCGDSRGPLPIFDPTPTPQTAVLVGAGDIGECGPQSGVESTGRILDRVEGTVITLGDNAYPRGRLEDYQSCYHATWGRHKARTRPSPGNHEYDTPGAAGYFDYYGAAAGPAGQGYYSYTAGNWRVLSLNSNVPMGPDSAQMQWVQSELATNATRCTMAYFHHPPFASGPRGGNPFTLEMWNELWANAVDVVVVSHEHNYERFATLDGAGRPVARGTRLFVVGTGGARLSGFGITMPGSEVRLSAFGVIKLTLNQDRYQWEFLNAAGGIGDAGTDSCR